MKNNPKAVSILTANSTSNPAETEQLAEAVNNQKDNAMQFPDEMTIIQCFWLVTKMAIPLVVGMLL